MFNYFNVFLILIFTISYQLSSSIWIEPKDELEIKKIELYSAQSNFNVRTTTYPLTINSLKNSSNFGVLNMRDKIKLNTLVNKNFKKNKKFSSSITFNAFSDDLMIRNIDDNWYSKNSIIFKNSYFDKNFSINLNLHFIEDSYDEKKIIYNGCHI